MRDLNPPAIVRPFAPIRSLAEMERQATELVEDIGQTEKMNLERRADLGDLLEEMKAACKHGEWEAVLDRIGVSSQDASTCRRLAKSRDRGIWGFKTITEALLVIAAQDSPAAAPIPTIFCRPCRTTGAKPNCKACAELRAAKAAENCPFIPPPHEREPGDDTDTEPQPKPPFNWALFNRPYGQLKIALDVYTVAFGARPEVGPLLKTAKEAIQKVRELINPTKEKRHG